MEIEKRFSHELYTLNDDWYVSNDTAWIISRSKSEMDQSVEKTYSPRGGRRNYPKNDEKPYWRASRNVCRALVREF